MERILDSGSERQVRILVWLLPTKGQFISLHWASVFSPGKWGLEILNVNYKCNSSYHLSHRDSIPVTMMESQNPWSCCPWDS